MGEVRPGCAAGTGSRALVGFLLRLFSLIDPLVTALNVALFGHIFRASLGLIPHALSGGQRDFSPVGGSDGPVAALGIVELRKLYLNA